MRGVSGSDAAVAKRTIETKLLPSFQTPSDELSAALLDAQLHQNVLAV